MKIHIEKVILDSCTGAKVTVSDDVELTEAPTAALIDSTKKAFLASVPDVSSLNVSAEEQIK